MLHVAANKDYQNGCFSKEMCCGINGTKRRMKKAPHDDASCKEADANKPYWNDTTKRASLLNPFHWEKLKN